MNSWKTLLARATTTLMTMFFVSCVGLNGNGAYTIQIRYAPNFPARFKPAFEAAAQRWQSVITADVPNYDGTIVAAKCGVKDQADVVGVDDLVIFADIIPYDANNPNLLGQAGPCFFRNTSFLTIVGTMAFVDNKMDGLLQANQLTDTVSHEMGHILGIGTHWSDLNLATGLSSDPNTCGTNPQFTGANALREYRALGGSGNIAIENLGGPGTCDGHWKESIFGAELMTGVLDDGVPNPLSRITLGSMQDLGYSVNLGAANVYTLSAPSTSRGRLVQNLIVTRPVEHVAP
jgi:hypothetical protein